MNRESIDDMVHNLLKGNIERKLNRYFQKSCPIYKIKASFINLIKYSINHSIKISINFGLLDDDLNSILSSDPTIIITLMDLNPEYFSIANSTLRADKDFVSMALSISSNPSVIIESMNDKLRQDEEFSDYLKDYFKTAVQANPIKAQIPQPFNNRRNNHVFAPVAIAQLANSGQIVKSKKSKSKTKSKSRSKSR